MFVVYTINSFLRRERLCPKAFKFFNSWTLREGFKELVVEGWRDEVLAKLNPLSSFKARLKNVKKQMKEWNRNEFGSVFDRIKGSEAQLLAIQRDISLDTLNLQLAMEEKEARSSYVAALREEEKMQNLNHILEVVKFDGSTTADATLIKAEAVHYFSTLFGDSQMREIILPNSMSFHSSLDDAHWQALVVVVSEEEIKSVVFQCKDSKAPGPNRFSAIFFKFSWDIIGQDLVKAI
ncbi:uncharacterized protein LOC122665503 [Telopea speciosissima]|uniref:uncharacterized protein LOC122665503 n=1 Tax=Telopea speciosissima TaxID=54955 RepID=UPI001CC66AFD|nr:uncharacterized protein LOC122665503 [Telopea speciosissima]